MNNDSIIKAINRISMATSAETVSCENGEIVSAINQFSKTVKDNLGPLYDSTRKSVLDLLISHEIDPFESNANFITFSNFDYNEPRWTQWIASCLRENANRGGIGRIFWKSICRAVIYEIAQTNSDERRKVNIPSNENIMDEDDWERAQDSEFEVKAECWTSQYGRPDIVVRTKDFVIVIENKTDSKEHSGQLKKYKQFAYREGKKAGLVFLTNDKYEYNKIESGYVNLTYRSLAQFLRYEYKYNLVNDKHSIKYWPILSTLVSIERDLLDLPNIHDCDNKDNLLELQKVFKYLKEAEDMSNEKERA